MLMQAELVWLLAAVAKGDEAAFERLYEATRAKLYGVLLRILGKPELADDVMQETYLKVWKMAGKFDPTMASPITWMVAIARNRAIDIVRKKGEVSIEEKRRGDGRRRRIRRAACAPRNDRRTAAAVVLSRQLDPEKQRIVLLAYYSGWSREQLATKARYPGEHHQDLAAPQPARNARVHGWVVWDG